MYLLATFLSPTQTQLLWKLSVRSHLGEASIVETKVFLFSILFCSLSLQLGHSVLLQ